MLLVCQVDILILFHWLVSLHYQNVLEILFPSRVCVLILVVVKVVLVSQLVNHQSHSLTHSLTHTWTLTHILSKEPFPPSLFSFLTLSQKSIHDSFEKWIEIQVVLLLLLQRLLLLLLLLLLLHWIIDTFLLRNGAIIGVIFIIRRRIPCPCQIQSLFPGNVPIVHLSMIIYCI